jgi:hypothetical protein
MNWSRDVWIATIGILVVGILVGTCNTVGVIYLTDHVRIDIQVYDEKLP